ncbi:MAG: hypothetical protein ACOCW8_02515 [bacterium]
MKIKYIVVLLIILAVSIFGGCTEKKDFNEPASVINHWADAIKKLDYTTYRRIEAFPKSERSFKKMYDKYFIENITVTEVDPVDGVQTGKDHNETQIEFKNVQFMANAVNRSTGKTYQSVMGQVKMIRYPEGEKSDRGWMLSNRTLVRINQ